MNLMAVLDLARKAAGDLAAIRGLLEQLLEEARRRG